MGTTSKCDITSNKIDEVYLEIESLADEFSPSTEKHAFLMSRDIEMMRPRTCFATLSHAFGDDVYAGDTGARSRVMASNFAIAYRGCDARTPILLLT